MKQLLIYILSAFILTSCIKQINLYQGDDKNPNKPNTGEDNNQLENIPIYYYPFHNENTNVVAEISITTKHDITHIDQLTTYIPHLKYNKSWLLLFTQDDAQQSAICRTWAAINGKPIANSASYSIDEPDKIMSFYYALPQLLHDDLPPNTIFPQKTLGSIDGAGNEVRFTFTTTLAPEEEWMSRQINVYPGFKDNFYRFYRNQGIDWGSVYELVNYDNSIAFHDVNAEDVYNPTLLTTHFTIAQNEILNNLGGRACKMLAEPNGNKTYLEAAFNYDDIQTMTSQGNYSDFLYPFQVTDDLEKKVFTRIFNDNPDYFKPIIVDNYALPKEERRAIYIGVHNTDNAWIDLLTWINDNYGKDGDDSVWFTSHEEYYEYNYYRIAGGTPQIELVDARTIKLIVSLPSKSDFYYPSTTVNLAGIVMDDIESINTNSVVSGLSYSNYEDGITLNIDCRRALAERAEFYVSMYERDKSNESYKRDALYFTNKLKDSDIKTELLKRIN